MSTGKRNVKLYTDQKDDLHIEVGHPGMFELFSKYVRLF